MCLSPHSNFLVLFFGLIDNTGRSGAESVAKFHINIIKLCMLPMIDLSCFNVSGFSD